MINDDFTLYRLWLNCGLETGKNQDKNFVRESFSETIQNSPAYQKDALVNGESQPIVATRKDTKKCSIVVIPGDELHIGDLIKVFNEYWLCVELYMDEYGMYYGELWMCNLIFHYQDFDLNIIYKHAILDDGSYSKGNEKAIAVTNNSFNCYMSLDEESRALFVDKRLGISVIYDSKGKEILEVGKIKWIDVKSKNFGVGSHLMIFGISDDQFNPEKDDIEKLICDYHESESKDGFAGETTSSNEKPLIKGEIFIEGRNTIKAGTGRTYFVYVIDRESGERIESPAEIKWELEYKGKGITISPNAASCKVITEEDDDLIGSLFLLKCVHSAGEYKEAEIEVEVT